MTRIVFRVDGSPTIGAGHIVRCLTLAKRLAVRGARPGFVCRDFPGAPLGLVAAAGFPLLRLPGEPAAGEDEDAAATLRALDGDPPDWLVVDHYGLGAGYERALRRHAGAVLAVDDIGRAHDCDLFLDQTYGRERAPPPAGGRLALLGARHALLADAYRAARRDAAADRPVRRVFLSFGGLDAAGATGLALDALGAPEFSRLAVDVAGGFGEAGSPGGRPRATFHRSLPDLAGLMAAADIAIGAGGVTQLERLCVGLPSIIVTVAGNQVAGAAAVAADGLAVDAGPIATLDPAGLGRTVAAFIADGGFRAAASRRGRLAVDGLGAWRVAEALIPTPAAELRLRPARADDVDLVFAWANDREVRAQSFAPEAIAFDDHEAWFARQLASPHRRHYVVEASGLPVGQARFDIAGGEARLGYLLDPLVRGRGAAARLVALAAAAIAAEGDMLIRAEVKPGNAASLAALRRLGFAEAADGGDAVAFTARASAVAARL